MELTSEIRAQRVAVAKDVIEQVRARRVIVSRGSYLSTKDCSDEVEGRVYGAYRKARERGVSDLKGVVDEIAPFCQACARGCLLLSKARLYNAVPLDRIFSDTAYASFSVYQEDTTELLADIFDARTLAMIEAAFERSKGHDKEGAAEWGDIAKSVSFGFAAADKATDWPGRSEAVILAVMENLIANDGEFLP